MKKNKIPLMIALIGMVVVIGVVFVIIHQKTKKPEAEELSTEMYSENANKTMEKWQEGVITYQGKDYVYNQDLSIYYLMGIDIEGPVQKASDGISGGQSDANFLLVADKETKQLTVFSINRNTMTDIELYGIDGSHLGTEVRQINLQHGYGDGMKLSCSLAVEAVEKLFYNIPINGYMSINMGAIPAINDAVGGVTVTILPGVDQLPGIDELEEGQTITLNGKQAYTYVRDRDCGVFDSATYRMRRQEQYVSEFLKKVKTDSGTNVAAAMDLYQAVDDYLVTDVDFEKLVTELLQYEYDSNRLYTVPGETKLNEVTHFEEFYVDEDAFYEQIIQVFYKEVEQ